MADPLIQVDIAGRLLIPLLVVSCLAAHGDGEEAASSSNQGVDDAIAAIVLHDFNQAYEIFDQALVELEVGTPAWDQAVFGKAISAHQRIPPSRAHIEEAQRLYLELIRASPQSPYASRAMLALARSYELRDYAGDALDDASARKVYQEVIDAWPDEEVADEAVIRLASSYIRDFETEGSIEYGIELLEQWLVNRPNNQLAWIQWEYLGECYMGQGNYPRALECLLNADKHGFNAVRVGFMYWLIAQLAEEVGRLDVAVEYYRRLVIEAPRGGRSYDGHLALRRIQAAHPEMEFDIPPVEVFAPPRMESSTNLPATGKGK